MSRFSFTPFRIRLYRDFINCTAEFDPLVTSRAKRNATTVQLLQKDAYDGESASWVEYKRVITECYELIILSLTLQVVLHVCKLRTEDVLLGNISRWEKVLAVCTGLRLVAVAFMPTIMQSIFPEAPWKGFILFNILWFTPLFASFASMLVLIRRAASGTDEMIHQRVVLQQVYK